MSTETRFLEFNKYTEQRNKIYYSKIKENQEKKRHQTWKIFVTSPEGREDESVLSLTASICQNAAPK